MSQLKLELDPTLLMIGNLATTNQTMASLMLGQIPEEQLKVLLDNATKAATALEALTNISREATIDSQIKLIPKEVELETAKGKLAMARGLNTMISQSLSGSFSNANGRDYNRDK